MARLDGAFEGAVNTVCVQGARGVTGMASLDCGRKFPRPSPVTGTPFILFCIRGSSGTATGNAGSR